MSYANWLSRVGGYIIDFLVILPFALLAGLLGGDGGVLYWVFVLAGVAVSGYNRWYLGGTTGQSWGRKAVGTTLVDATSGQPIGVGKAFLRDVAHIVDTLICYIGWLFPLWDKKRQTLADKIVKTVVTN